MRDKTSLVVVIPLTRGSPGAWPVSTNKLYRRSGSGPVLTTAARLWRQTVQDHTWAAWVALDGCERRRLIGARYWTVRLAFRLPGGCRFDADNLVKLVQDGLKEATGIDDRRYRPVPAITPGQPSELRITIAPTEEGAP